MRKDPLSKAYSDLLDGTYDCPDRIVLNAYADGIHSPGGFRTWWRLAYGNDSTLDKNHIVRFAGRCSRRVKAFCAKNDIPLIFCGNDDRQHESVEQHFPTDPGFAGVFCITVKRSPAPAWECGQTKNGFLDLKMKYPWVNQYSFHVIDREWGHMSFKLNPHPPFSVQICLNGHEYVECSAREAGISFTKEDNCFTDSSNLAGLSRIAEAMNASSVVGRLAEACERWVYTACLCFALPLETMKACGFHYRYSVYQVEFSRNLLFHRGAKLDQVFQGLIDRTRGTLNIKRLKTIFGYNNRPHRKRSGKSPRFEVTVEKPAYDLTIFKIHFSKLTVKIYSKGERVLRTEAIAHNVRALKTRRRGIEHFPAIIEELREILMRFLTVVQGIDMSYVDSGILNGLAKSGRVGAARVGGINLEQPRMRAVFSAALTLTCQPHGFTARQLAEEVRSSLGYKAGKYTPVHAAYDIKKLRLKKLVLKIEHSRRYKCSVRGLRAIAAIITLKDKIIIPLLSNLGKKKRGRKPGERNNVDRIYDELQDSCRKLFPMLGIAV